MRLSQKGFTRVGIHPREQAALTARRNRHVARDEEGEATEHPLLGEVGLVRELLPDPLGEVLVVRHGPNYQWGRSVIFARPITTAVGRASPQADGPVITESDVSCTPSPSLETGAGVGSRSGFQL